MTWPALPLKEWQATCDTLHLWTQIVGKVRLAQSPWINHSWHVVLYVTSRGLTTSSIPHGERSFQIEFDFLSHRLVIDASDGGHRDFPLRAQTVAEFHETLFVSLRELRLPVRIHGTPNEVANPIPFAQDREHRAYDAEYAQRFWRVLLQTQRVLSEFRAGFIGKSSPVHFFWGGFDLALTRFSGRRAPAHPGAIPHLPAWVAREAYSHEVSSVGFWPGGGPHPFALFYSYAYPEPQGFSEARVHPEAAFYSQGLKEFILPYDAVREAASPDAALLEFAQSTYDAAADLGGWDRGALEQGGVVKL